MITTEVTTKREETGNTREKTKKWEGTCFTCDNCTKRGFCNIGNTWGSYVKNPNLYCESWSEK
jgi:hypothetical protein